MVWSTMPKTATAMSGFPPVSINGGNQYDKQKRKPKTTQSV